MLFCVVVFRWMVLLLGVIVFCWAVEKPHLHPALHQLNDTNNMNDMNAVAEIAEVKGVDCMVQVNHILALAQVTHISAPAEMTRVTVVFLCVLEFR